ncbi:PilW family protein [Schinkia azotoformans]|uniref:PilW family protein n=1 Tax=Schinkia azotoformans TaxID=1454 RepID=UPI002DB91A39|nr:prepilin-type N-terminal cleavage/methylation domain-containing protein [Schinkia azotoformans]MEC1759130.1 prepilin-type N-terminal cleavage/methylation domain-containing protein [Schinkia azotoformans]
MRHYANLLKNNHGVTLIELLTALVISTLVLGIAYGLLLTGYKTYEKVGIEQGLRNEADYVVSQIMQTFYKSDISDIKQSCQSTSTNPSTSGKNICIEVHSTAGLQVTTNNNTKQVGIANLNELKNSLTVTQIKIVKETIDGHDVQNILIEDYEAERGAASNGNIKIKNPTSPTNSVKINTSTYDFIIAPTSSDEGSEINATCSYESTIITDSISKDKFINKKCTNGLVNISLIIKRASVENDKFKIQLKSQFGF